jgi:hypothetical protein
MRKKIGEFFVEKGVLTPAQVDQILEYGKKSGLRFGEAGVSLGLLDRETLVRLFGRNYSVDFFHLDPRFFPKETKDAIPVPLILRFGALPLGAKSRFKMFRTKKILNIGLLDPGRKDAVEAIERLLQDKTSNYDAIKVFLVLADQFIEVVQSVYGVSDKEIHAKATEDLDRTLALFVEGSS